MNHSETYFAEVVSIAREIDHAAIEALALHLVVLRGKGGRLFVIGLGGSAANASHAASDFQNLCGLKAVCLTDNAAEFTAAANDNGWGQAFVKMLVNRSIGYTDTLMVLSVGGGTDTVSLPLTKAMEYARAHMCAVVGIVGRDGGETKKHAFPCVIIPTVEPSRVTPHTEAFQMAVIHALVSHPQLQIARTKW